MPALNSTTEHFMNYGFLNKLMNSSYLPVEDIWLSGNNINYYYFGQYITAFLNKVSTTQVEESYNLMIALLAAFLFVLPYSIGKTLGNNLIKEKTEKFAKIVPVAIGIIAGLAVSLGGTTYYTVYKLALNEETYFYADACYYIGYRPETQDKTITAFPSYMNLEGDLHAHYMDTMFALTMLALLLQYILAEHNENESRRKRLLNGNILLIGILLGIQKMTNYWDFPIYLVIIGAVITVKNFMKYKEYKQKILVTLIQLLEIVLLEELLTATFSAGLYISATKVYLTNITSPLYKLVVLWGLPIICIIFHIVSLLYQFLKEKKGNIFQYIKRMNLSDIYIIILGVCAIGLVILPEIIYLKDIYNDEYKRANTMFKLTFNAITLFHICGSYILIKYLYEKGSIIKKVAVAILLVIFVSTFGYGLDAISYCTNGLKNQTDDIRNVESYVEKNLPDDYKAIQWIKQNIDRDAVILQKAAGSYTKDTRISVFTANPTILGWHGHEWIWRAKSDYSIPDEVNERWSAIFQIYQSKDEEEVRSLIEKYNISYIYIGNVEYTDFNNINLDLLLNMGEVVYQDDVDYIQSPVYIIKCK